METAGVWKPFKEESHILNVTRHVAANKTRKASWKSGKTKQEDADIYETIQRRFTEKRCCKISCSYTRGHKGRQEITTFGASSLIIVQ